MHSCTPHLHLHANHSLKAHNIEKSGEEASSFDLMPAQIASGIAELDNLLAKDDEVWDTENKISKEDITLMKVLLLNFEVRVQSE